MGSTLPAGYTFIDLTLSPCLYYVCIYGGKRWRICLGHCSTSRKVAGSSDCTTALGSTQTLTEMSARNTSWAGGWGMRLVLRAKKPYHLSVPVVSKSGSLRLLETSVSAIGLNTDCFTLYIYIYIYIWCFIAYFPHDTV